MEIPLLLWNDGFRQRLVANVRNEQARLFWQRYEAMSRREKEDFVGSTDNKVAAYLQNEIGARIVAQSRSTINFRQIMDEGKILLVLLSPQLAEVSRLVGSILIGRLLMAAYSRVDTPELQRRQFHLYCDEYQRFATSDFQAFINETQTTSFHSKRLS